MKPTKKVGILLLAGYLILEGAVPLVRQINPGGLSMLISLLAIAAGIFLILDR